MSNRFALFLFAFWLPTYIAAIGLFGEHFSVALQSMSFWKITLIQYAALLIGSAPILYVIFFRKKKLSEQPA